MPVPLANDARLADLLAATDKLTAAGQPFEVAEDEVLGERVAVFANRPRSMRQVLAGASVFGDADCYVFDDGRRISFVELQRQAAVVAASWRDRYGVGPGDRVAICAANCPEWLLTFWAVANLNAVLVAMNGWWTGTEMRNAIQLTEPSLLLMDEKRRARLDAHPDVATILIEREFASLLHEHEAPPPDSVIAEDDPFILIFTSGTTGKPKAAVLSHRSVIGYLMLQSFLAARGAVLAGRTASSGPGPVRLAAVPLFHVSGLSMAVGTVMSGAASVWPLGRFDAANVVELTLRENISVWGGGIAHVNRLLACPEVERLPAGQVVQVTLGGSATTPEIMRQAEVRFPQLTGTMSSGYGSTETGGLASWAPNWMLRAAPDCVGAVLPTVQVRITDDGGQEVADGAEGNIEVRSALTMLGYWNNAVANKDAIRPGRWVVSGDFGRREDGLLFIASRRRDLIIRGGENIYPFEIENRLDEHPHVLEAAVFGVDDPVYGQVVKAVVVIPPDTTLSDDEVRDFCAQTLASYKVPLHVEVRTSPLPRNASGKVMKHVLSGAAQSDFVGDDG